MIVVISEEQYVPSELQHWLALFDAGLENLHLRKYGLPDQLMLSLLNQIPNMFRKYLVMHSHQHLAAELGIERAHLKREGSIEMEYQTFRKSCSTHSLEEFNQLTCAWEYAFLGPFYSSISKPGYQANPDLANALAITQRQNYHTKLIALGGISKKQISKLSRFDIDGIALKGGIWQSENPAQSFKEIQKQYLNEKGKINS
ncbi:thiamine phosphate synthase [Sphingobacterium sp. 1.A.4]|uniref:thiamine phosphate synthase n=1 Tax=Sphingobacterium sp. 1.A.4 TaxID=2044603 RepID=UPI000C0BD026|nr:thiamine phosphate synthase [Sphingobacterium sp. 1.A.4]